MVVRLQVKELHGLYNYDINFPEEPKVYIITGPNGYGKTTILKILSHVMEGKFWYFFFIKFSQIEITFDNERMVSIEKIIRADEETEEIAEGINSKIRISFYLSKQESPLEELALEPKYLNSLIKRYKKGYAYSDSWEHDSDMEDILERDYKLETDSYWEKNGKNLQMFLREQQCSYIKEQRLLSDQVLAMRRPSVIYEREAGKIYEPEINVIDREFKGRFFKTLISAGSYSQQIDATFIKRLMEYSKDPYSEETFTQKLEKLQKKIAKLRNYNLSQQIDIPKQYMDGLKKVLSLYIDDMERKISVFDEFVEQLDAFYEMVSNKSLSNKKLILNEDDGIKLVNDRQEAIPLNKLSSGEQNLIILYYKLIFSLKKKSIVFIDEPENSLHIAWLNKMLDDYMEIANKMQCQIIIATHSPAFINGNWDLTYDLYENNC